MRITQNQAVMVLAVSLLVAAGGVFVQVWAGAEDYPLVPPGGLLLLAAGALVAWRPRLWAVAIGTVLNLGLSVGAVLTPNVGDHFAHGNAGIVGGTVVQLAAMACALGAGTFALTRSRPGRSGGSGRPGGSGRSGRSGRSGPRARPGTTATGSRP
ncbi:hypothetical protein [Streptomyces iconiensis]|uniref:SPW repeat-containing protein n=1 Tax=Streptomyces iconiensis TaxID=1384038 RepID=A0ABT6ZRS2_9ACTN|nr:hypothetical protein [Streptomyces iconiensis]MDJ1131562.1 hypothetical protein [Streptomyces iconiensis]